MAYKYNFNSVSGVLFPEVRAQIQAELWDFQGTGLSVLGLPHRSVYVLEMMERVRALTVDLLSLGTDFEVLLLVGGASHQMLLLPMNFLENNQAAAFVDTGLFSQRAFSWASYYGRAAVLASSQEQSYRCIPALPSEISPDTAYVHITYNNTAYGTQWLALPEVAAPLAADMTSALFSSAADISRCAFVYASTQKNIGIPGLTFVLIRKDFLAQKKTSLPPLFDYRHILDKQSVPNTLPVFTLYVALCTLRHIADRGGLEVIEAENKQKAQCLYEVIDAFSVYQGKAERAFRSLMNVCLEVATPVLEKKFLEESEKEGIFGIKGHTSVGGIRIALYNAVSLSEVQALRDFMVYFAEQYV